MRLKRKQVLALLILATILAAYLVLKIAT